MKLGIVADEFFSRDVGRMGGFGRAARQVAQIFNRQPQLGVSVVFLAASLKSNNGSSRARVHDTPLIFYAREPQYRDRLLQENFDLILTIDYRPKYSRILEILGSTPVIVWVRDPRPPATQARLDTLRLPGDEAILPKGIKFIDCRSLSLLQASPVQPRRPFLLATPAPTLSLHIEDTYGISGTDCAFLPGVIDMGVGKVKKSETPRVIFLGRLDPIKRPWLFVELARAFPQVEFLMLGQSHFQGRGGWLTGQLPANVKMLGHIDGEQKVQLLTSAWVLINTSIHEAMPISFLEALACETPLLSCHNPEGIVSQYGIFTGSSDGDGMSSLPAFASTLAQLIEQHDRRTRLGQEGRRWVERTHNAITFLSAFDTLCARAGVYRQSPN